VSSTHFHGQYEIISYNLLRPPTESEIIFRELVEEISARTAQGHKVPEEEDGREGALAAEEEEIEGADAPFYGLETPEIIYAPDVRPPGRPKRGHPGEFRGGPARDRFARFPPPVGPGPRFRDRAGPPGAGRPFGGSGGPPKEFGRRRPFRPGGPALRPSGPRRRRPLPHRFRDRESPSFRDDDSAQFRLQRPGSGQPEGIVLEELPNDNGGPFRPSSYEHEGPPEGFGGPPLDGPSLEARPLEPPPLGGPPLGGPPLGGPPLGEQPLEDLEDLYPRERPSEEDEGYDFPGFGDDDDAARRPPRRQPPRPHSGSHEDFRGGPGRPTRPRRPRPPPEFRRPPRDGPPPPNYRAGPPRAGPQRFKPKRPTVGEKDVIDGPGTVEYIDDDDYDVTYDVANEEVIDHGIGLTAPGEGDEHRPSYRGHPPPEADFRAGMLTPFRNRSPRPMRRRPLSPDEVIHPYPLRPEVEVNGDEDFDEGRGGGRVRPQDSR